LEEGLPEAFFRSFDEARPLAQHSDSICWSNGTITDENDSIIQVMLKGHKIQLGITLSRLIEYLGHPNGPDGEEADESCIILTYYVDGDYYYFFFSPSDAGDDSKLIVIDVNAGW
jgi:hypothetical protein